MIGGLDFSMDEPTKITLIVCLLFPIALMLIARLPQLARRNALQFLASFIVVTLIWMGILIWWLTQAEQIEMETFMTCFFLYTGMMLIYLEAWGLLSRGYTLGLLLTFYKAKKAISVNELANSYRDGKGLDWLIKHRFSGLAAAKVVKIEKNQVILTLKGILVAYVYQFSIWFFGLRHSG